MGNCCCCPASCPRRWTEGVRREWLAVVVPRAGACEEGEGEDALTPATPTHPLDDLPLTTSFSREEIEALITARRDPPVCVVPRAPREEDQTGHQLVGPESLAVELERELTALRVHVLRSHALLHHYQSTGSQYGSRAEVSTPTPAAHHATGVEVGVECDLCGPTCVPRPCDSTATQTPASPLPTTPECEESVTTLLTTAFATTITAPTPTTKAKKQEGEEEAEEEEEGGVKTKNSRSNKKRPEEEEEKRGVVILNEEISATKTDHDDLLLSVGGGAKDDPHHHQHQQRPRQVGFLELPEHRELRQVQVVPPAHRTLRQLGVNEEEEEQELDAAAGEEGEIILMASDHTLYSPKPAYDHLDQYRSGVQARGAGEEKTRRSGLANITPTPTHATTATTTSRSTAGDGSDTVTTPPRPRPSPTRPQVEVTPLSPPPSLDNVEEEDGGEDDEEEPALPSTPESTSSMASGDMFTPSPPVPRAPQTRRLPRQVSINLPDAPEKPSAAPAAPRPRVKEEGSEKEERVYPSLHDTVLRAAGLLRDDPTFTSNENLTAQEIESKFTQLSLAFKTDSVTLRQRLDLQQRHRDTAETNLDTEFSYLKNAVLALHTDCLDSELVDAVTQVRRHLEILAASSTRLVSTSEVWGAVQQEWRVSRALEVLFLHVENVRRMYERDHQELEELRRLLNEYQIELPVSQGTGGTGNAGGSGSQSSTDSPGVSRRLRALSLAVCSNKGSSAQENRRTSVAASSSTKSAASNFMSSARSRGRRASLMPDLKPFREQLAAVSAAAAAAAAFSSSSSSSAAVNGAGASKDCVDDMGPGVSLPNRRRWGCSITEEGSESSGEEERIAADQQDSTNSNANNKTNNNSNNNSNNNNATNTTTTNTPPNTPSSLSSTSPSSPATLDHPHPDFVELNTDEHDSDERMGEESCMPPKSQGDDCSAPSPVSLWTRSRPQHWLVLVIEGVLGWVRGGQWPYSQQQTVQGARYAFTSLLLVLAALFLLVTLSSGDASAPVPYHPGWTTIRHVLHPYVTLRYLDTPPT